MPILEALSHGIPCAVSDIPVFHEIGGDVVTYFNQNDPQDITKKIVACLHNDNKDAHMFSEYLKTQPNWQIVAQKVVEHIQVTLDAGQKL